MAATVEQIKALAAPTPEAEIGSKPGRGGSGNLSYIDARFVFDRFDSAVGPQNWSCTIAWTGNVHTPAMTNRKDEVIIPEWESTYPVATLGVLTKDGWVYKSDIGDFSDIESLKGSVSDSIKRAAVQWGVARDLYPKPSDKKSKKNSRRSGNSESGDAATTSGNSSSRGTGRNAKTGDQSAERVGLTSQQTKKLMATIREKAPAIDGKEHSDQRRAFVSMVTMTNGGVGKQSVKQMTDGDLDAVLTALDNIDKSPAKDFLEMAQMVETTKEVSDD